MSTCFIIDTFPEFLTWWHHAEHHPIDEQIESWVRKYMEPWPELLSKQLDDYESHDTNWRRIARDKIFPHLEEHIPIMQEAYQNLLPACRSGYELACKKFGFDTDINYVIYVGIGNGAGWATEFAGLPAVLFGLETIAENSWNNPAAIQSLVAHELGHLVHYHWRDEQKKAKGTGPWWHLYEEGFAQRAESLILGEERSFNRKGIQWLDWCHINKKRLAAEFLKTVDGGKQEAPFFGSWYEILGKSETGYFLGYEAIKELEQQISFKDIALIDDVAVYLRPVIDKILSKI
jgi:hypothetical protein